ncbi:MAG TPA: M23 family metallopeptidase, partial [Steroidobacteraceae bacterium]|nr:M23 family metallopeptidase [Steroidobacteraceae bacterium]
MQKAITRLGLVWMALLSVAPLGVIQAQNVSLLTPLVADVLNAPQAVLGSDGDQHLVYEVRVENLTDGRFTLKQITVTDASGIELAQLDAQAIRGRFSLGGRRGSETDVLGPFQFGVAFLHVSISASRPVPTSLTHVVRGYSEKVAAEFSMPLASTPVSTASPVALSAPLRGTGYVAADGCCDSIRHVRALLPLGGRFALAQRFAIDWEKVDDHGRIFVGDSKAVSSYRIYGDPVYAVADGTVVASRSDLDDQIPGKLPEGLDLDEADGNFVIMQLRPGIYALYAHMKKGSSSLSTGA